MAGADLASRYLLQQVRKRILKIAHSPVNKRLWAFFLFNSFYFLMIIFSRPRVSIPGPRVEAPEVGAYLPRVRVEAPEVRAYLPRVRV